MKLYTILEVTAAILDATSDMRATVERLTAENEALRRGESMRKHWRPSLTEADIQVIS